MPVCYDPTTDNAIPFILKEAEARKKAGKNYRMCFVNDQSDPEEEEKTQRTFTQNKAMRKYWALLAEALNDAGYDMKKVMKPEAEIPWTRHSVEHSLWRPIMKAMFGYESTAELDIKQPSEIYEVINRKISTTTGVSVPWPSREEMMRAQQ